MTTSFLTEVMLRGFAVALAGGLLCLALNSTGTAGQRCRALRFTFAALLLLPLVVALAPGWTVLPSFDPGVSTTIAEDSSIYVRDSPTAAPQESGFTLATPPQPHASPGHPISWQSALMGLYIAGLLSGILPLALAHGRLRRLRRDSSPCEDRRMESVIRKAKVLVCYRSKKVDVRFSKQACMPMTWGLRHPVILLPEESKSWPEERLLAVIAHECTHIRRRDGLASLGIQVARALHWPNPLVWWLFRRWRMETERACDATVVAHGVVPPSDYATALHSVAQSYHTHRKIGSVTTALPMARKTTLEDRVQRILRPATPTSRLAKVGEALLLGICLTVSVIAQQAPAPKSPAKDRGQGSAVITLTSKLEIHEERFDIDPTKLPTDKRSELRSFLESNGIPFDAGVASSHYDKEHNQLVVRNTRVGVNEVRKLVARLNSEGPTEGYIIHAPAEDRQTVVNRALCERAFPPFSTYKIPNSILALEADLVSNLDETVPYEAERHPKKDWWPRSWTGEHSLRSAFQNSVVWYYQDLAARMNQATINSSLLEWHYGKGQVTEKNLTDYWLGNGLTITAKEQINFLQRFHESQLGLAEETTTGVKSIAFAEEREGKRLYAKTGTGDLNENLWLAWYVGWIEEAGKDGETQYFALLCLDHSFADVRKRRRALREKVLGEMGFE